MSDLIHCSSTQAIRAMSQMLPETAEQMLQISHVTKANFDKYGEGLLKICQQHAVDKIGMYQDCTLRVKNMLTINIKGKPGKVKCLKMC